MITKYEVWVKGRKQKHNDLQEALLYALKMEKLGYKLQIYMHSQTIYTDTLVMIYKSKN